MPAMNNTARKEARDNHEKFSLEMIQKGIETASVYLEELAQMPR
jgi:hypothetical protein